MSAPTSVMSTLHLVIGPVGAGKTTFAGKRAAQLSAVFLDLDPWMVRLYGKDARPPDNVVAWYLERRGRCRAVLWDVARAILSCGTDVFLELGLVSRLEREAFYAEAALEDCQLRIYCLDAPREVRRQRVALRNESANENTQVVPMPFFELASDAWQPPSETECQAMGIIVL